MTRMLLLAACVAAIATATTVVTQSGAVKGYKSDRYPTYTFRGIPYAAPPVGNLRFAPTEPVVPWNTTRDATEFGAMCMQDCEGGKFTGVACSPTMSEDCLNLNVYTPTTDNTAALPVIMFIHGGFFNWGTGGCYMYDGNEWAHRENIVVVTINYRLNIFAGLHTGAVEGSFALHDQRMAMRWVQKNIAAFGGDASKVTISGQSAGAVSIGMHIVSNQSWPYFHRAIVESDPYGVPTLTKTMARELGESVVVKLGCPLGGAAELACLRNQSAETILKMKSTMPFPSPANALGLFMPWGPVIGSADLPENPVTLMEKGNFNRVPMMVGTVQNESVPFIYGMPKLVLNGKFATTFLEFLFHYRLTAGIEKLYGPVPKDEASFDAHYIARIFTDYGFFCPTRHVAKMANKFNSAMNTYLYVFDEVPSFAKWYSGKGSPCAKWVCHAFDLPAVFGSYKDMTKFGVPLPTPEEEKLSHFVQNAWASLARNGTVGEGWAPYTQANPNIYNLSIPLPTPGVPDLRKEFCDYFDTMGYTRY